MIRARARAARREHVGTGQLRRRHQAFGDTTAVDDLTLHVADGELLVLLGSSGCGKTTALRMVAGLEDLTSGTVSIGERVVNDVDPKDRDVAMVFQSYALYPHLTVAKNIEFPLRQRGVDKEERATKVKRAAETLGLSTLLDRKPGQLSGGQRQRVALARAIVREPARLPDGRAAVEPRRRAAGADPGRHRRAAGAAVDDHALRHPRPGRGDDDGRPHRRHERGEAATGGRARGALRPAGQRVRGALPRQPRHEPH